ncbi:MAG: hypothetical protein ACC642_11975 [Pseudomonadales bacterium]
MYSAKIVFTGSFPALDAVYPDQAGVRVMLDQARLSVGVSHTQAISSASALISWYVWAMTGIKSLCASMAVRVAATPAAPSDPRASNRSSLRCCSYR